MLRNTPLLSIYVTPQNTIIFLRHHHRLEAKPCQLHLCKADHNLGFCFSSRYEETWKIRFEMEHRCVCYTWARGQILGGTQVISPSWHYVSSTF